MAGADLDKHKSAAFACIERNAGAIALVGDSIFYFGELGNQEYQSAALMSGLLEKEGFEVTRGLSGFPTAFLATHGSGKPVVIVDVDRITPAPGRLRTGAHRRGRARPLRGPQRQRRGDDRRRHRAAPGDGGA